MSVSHGTAVSWSIHISPVELYKKNDQPRKTFDKFRGWSRAAATSKMEPLVIIANGWKPLIIMTKRSILDVAAALDPPLWQYSFS